MLLSVSGHETNNAYHENKFWRQVSNSMNCTFKTHVTEGQYF